MLSHRENLISKNKIRAQISIIHRQSAAPVNILQWLCNVRLKIGPESPTACSKLKLHCLAFNLCYFNSVLQSFTRKNTVQQSCREIICISIDKQFLTVSWSVLLQERDYVTFGYLLSRLSSVAFMHSTQPVEIFPECLHAILYPSYPLTSMQILRRSSQGNPSVGG